MGVATRAGKLLGILGQDPSGSKARFTLGVEAKGQGKSHDPIGWELKADPKSFRLGVKATNYSNILLY